jgi:hypothetical protein
MCWSQFLKAICATTAGIRIENNNSSYCIGSQSQKASANINEDLE